jgi:uracil-DNA glycosylase family 4
MPVFPASASKDRRFADLVTAVRHCSLCPRLCGRTKVLSSANGNLDARVLFVAEAPGRLGADRTGVPLCGDRTGDNFESLLGNVGWSRSDIFATNSLLCNPRDEEGNNGTPTVGEIENCGTYLDMTIELVDPPVVVALGATALAALERISPHGKDLRTAVGKRVEWNGRFLVPMYHPGPRALIHRSLLNQRRDFMELAKWVHPAKGLLKEKKRRPPKPLAASGPSMFEHVLVALVAALGRVTYFKLTKLLYFVDLLALERHGRALTGAVYIRQVQGPWCPEIRRAIDALRGHEIHVTPGKGDPIVSKGFHGRFEPSLADSAMQLLAEVVNKYGPMSDAGIKIAAYRTKPMRAVLHREREGADMRNKVLLYGDKMFEDADTARTEAKSLRSRP